MVDAVVVANECIGHAAEFQQAIPIGLVAGQTRDFQAQHDAHVSQSHFAGKASETGASVGAGAGEAEIFIDNHYLLRGPAQLAGSFGQGILAYSELTIMLDLAWCGLAIVNAGGALDMRRLDLGEISHWFPPGARRFGLP